MRKRPAKSAAKRPAYSTVVKALEMALNCVTEHSADGPPKWFGRCPWCEAVTHAQGVLDAAKAKPRKRR